MEPPDLTVDTQIIMIGKGMSDLPCTEFHDKLLNAFHESAVLALDWGGHIQQEYEAKMGEVSPGRAWLRKLAEKDRIKYFELPRLERRLKVALDDANFHGSDRKFVRLATATRSRCLVAEEVDYSTRVRRALKNDGKINLHSARSAYEWLQLTAQDEA